MILRQPFSSPVGAIQFYVSVFLDYDDELC